MLEDCPNLIEYAKQGNIVLFLGAGASLSAKDGNGDSPPLASELGSRLSQKFLNGSMATASLTQIAECAIAETSTSAVQDYIKEILEPFNPGIAHRLLPRFSWAGIATTNYDLLVEKAYADAGNPLQIIQPYVYDEQIEKLSDSTDTLPYLKLHGCLNHMGPGAVPLVITPEQYLDYENGRRSVFDTFEEWARRFTFVFVGYGAQDLNIRQYITRLVENVDDRMRFYFVRPGWETPEKRLWETRKITAIDADFDTFLTALDNSVDDTFRGFQVEVQMPPQLRKHFSSEVYSLSQNAANFFKTKGTFVESLEIPGESSAKSFFDGNSEGWTFTANNWDIMRSVAEDIIIEIFLDDNQLNDSECTLVVLRGYAGSGKTVAIKRLAWELVHEHDGIAIFVERPENLNSGAIAEVAELTGKRVYVFIDDLSSSYRSFRNCVKGLASFAKKSPLSQALALAIGIRSKISSALSVLKNMRSAT